MGSQDSVKGLFEVLQQRSACLVRANAYLALAHLTGSALVTCSGQ